MSTKDLSSLQYNGSIPQGWGPGPWDNIDVPYWDLLYMSGDIQASTYHLYGTRVTPCSFRGKGNGGVVGPLPEDTWR